MQTRELNALAEECAAIEQTLTEIPDDAWAGPGLGDWSLHELATHLTRSMGRISVYLAEGTQAASPEIDRFAYYRYDPATVAPGVAERARREAAEIPVGQVAEAFAATSRQAVEDARIRPADELMPSPFGVIALGEYLATRVLEAVVHHIDVRRALDLPPSSTVEAARVTMELLEGLLGEPRPRNFGRNRFILAATGRWQVDDPRFPVLG